MVVSLTLSRLNASIVLKVALFVPIQVIVLLAVLVMLNTEEAVSFHVLMEPMLLQVSASLANLDV